MCDVRFQLAYIGQEGKLHDVSDLDSELLQLLMK